LKVTKTGGALDEGVRCQLVLEAGQENLWPSNVYFLYQFKVNGERRSDYQVPWVPLTIWCKNTARSQEHRSNAIARMAITEPGKYECEWHMYFCGAYSHKNHIHRLAAHIEVGVTASSMIRIKNIVVIQNTSFFSGRPPESA